MSKGAGLRRGAVEQVDEADGQEMLVGCQGCLPPLILVVRRRTPGLYKYSSLKVLPSISQTQQAIKKLREKYLT
jgi:hypothetical protein